MNRPIVALPQQPEQPHQPQQAQPQQTQIQPPAAQPAQLPIEQPVVPQGGVTTGQPIQQQFQQSAQQPIEQPAVPQPLPPSAGPQSGLNTGQQFAGPDPGAAQAPAAAQAPTLAWTSPSASIPQPNAGTALPFAPPDPAAAQAPTLAWTPPSAPIPQATVNPAQPFAAPDPAAVTAPAAASAASLAWAPAATSAAIPQAVPQAVPQAIAQTPVQPAAAAPQAQPAKARAAGVRIGLAQILCWQLALVAVAVAANGPLGVLIGTSAAAVGLVAVTAVPVRGAWPHQWAGIATRFLLRRRRTELPESTAHPSATVAAALLEPWLGRTTFDATAVRDRPLALVSNQAAVSALLRLDPAGPAVSTALTSLLEPGAGLLDTLEEQPADVEIQLVVHAGLRHDSQPRGWIAIAASRTHDLNSDARLTMLVKNAARRVLRHLERTGATAAQVDDNEAATTLVSLAHANAGRGHVRERWTTWSAGPVSQSCLRLAGFTKLQPAAAEALVEALAGTAVTASVTVAVSARVAASPVKPNTPAVERREPVVRVAAASAGALDVAITVLSRLARAYGVHPERLEGRHGPGVAASLPIARALV